MTDSAANGQELANDFVNISSMGAGSEDSGAVGDTRGAGTRGRRARQEVRIPEKAMRYSDPNERIRVAEDQLGIRIDRLRKRVDTPLFFQVGLESEEYDWIALQLGEFLETRLEDPAEWDNTVSTARRLLVATLTLAAMGADNEKAFWPEFWRRMGITRVPRFESYVRSELERLLRTSGLRDFSGMALRQPRYVNMCTLHAGFQSSNLLYLTDVMNRKLDAAPASAKVDIDGDEFGGAIVLACTTDVDAPVGLSQFSNAFPTMAATMFARVMEYVQYTRTTPGWFDDTDFEGTNGIPSVLFDELRTVLNGKGTGAGDARGGSSSVARPRLKLDLQTWDIQLSLPEMPREELAGGNGAGALPDAADGRWMLQIGERSREVPAGPLLGRRGFAACDVALPEPVESIEVEHPGSGRSWTVPGIDPDVPLLLLRTNGFALSNQRRVGATRVFALHPEGTEFIARELDGGVRELAGLSLGLLEWPGWQITQFNLEGLRAFDAEFPTGATVTTLVASGTEIEFEVDGKEIEGLTTADGPVLGQSPTIVLPHGTAADWAMSIDYVSPQGEVFEILAGQAFDESAETFPTEIFDSGWNEPWVGTFDVHLYHRQLLRISRRFAIAEGIENSVNYNGGHGRFLAPTSDHRTTGVTLATFELRNPGGKSVTFPSGNARVEELDLSRPVTFSTGDIEDPFQLEARFTADHLQFTITRDDGTQRWYRKTTELDIDELAKDGHLTVRFPHQVHRVQVILFSRKKQHLGQFQMSSFNQGHRWVLSSNHIRDAIGDFDSIILAMQWAACSDRPRMNTSTLMILSQQPLVKAATIEDGVIEIEVGRKIDEELLAWAWPLHAPEAPVALQVKGTKAALPAELFGAGPLVIDAREGGFLVDTTPPSRPTRRCVFAEQSSVWPWADDPRHRVASFLSGERRGPISAEDSPVFWAAVNSLSNVLSRPSISLPSFVCRVVDRVFGEIFDNPRHSLTQLGKSTIEEDIIPGMVIASGLMQRSFAVEDTLNEFHRVDWVGLFEEMNDLPLLKQRADRGEGSISERGATLSYIANTGGPALNDALRTGIDTLTSLVRLDRRTYGYLQDAVDPLAEDSSPVENAFAVSLPARETALIEAANNSHVLNAKRTELALLKNFCMEWEHLLEKSGNQTLLVTSNDLREDATAMWSDGHWWAATPFISHTMAYLSRLRAHDQLRAIKGYESVQIPWRFVASVLPRLTRFDTLMAEAITLHSVYGDLVGDPATTRIKDR